MRTEPPQTEATRKEPLHIEVDGRPVTDTSLSTPAFLNYGHFTAMQVSDCRVRGLALHLARLDSATRELFGAGLDGGHVCRLIRHALDAAGVRDASTRVYVHWPDGDDAATVMVTVRPPAAPSGEPQSLMSVPYQRPVPHIKHLGGFGQIHYGRAAVRAGFDAALLTGPGGVIAEGDVTNIAFWDGTSVVWPDAPALTGITMALIEPGLPSVRRRVTLDGLDAYRSAFVTNSRGISPVRRIDSTEFAVDEELMRRVAEVYASAPWDEIPAAAP
ncbi:aminotransferase class IV [Streptomyces sp. NBC_00963]|uniref:aminotransferase class IV n=1 Tax=Streptomyces sp. NBC_00963 TaxID=2903697 RepID=UPI00386AB00D|nr:aminotransferase class IV [Streptomyces sp. NBC_00963]